MFKLFLLTIFTISMGDLIGYNRLGNNVFSHARFRNYRSGLSYGILAPENENKQIRSMISAPKVRKMNRFNRRIMYQQRMMKAN